MIDLIDSIALCVAKRDRERLEGPLQRRSIQATPLREREPSNGVSGSHAEAVKRAQVIAASGGKGERYRRLVAAKAAQLAAELGREMAVGR